MTLVVDVSTDGVRAPLARERLRAIATAVLRAERIPDALVSIALVSSRAIARLNRRHLRHTGPTDVFSFSLRAGGVGGATQPLIGFVYIAPDVARAIARRFGRGVREEVARLVVHGTLHVLGYDHPEGTDRTASPMWQRQERLLSSAAVQRALSGARTS
jgi:probable rRNA maturation factor